MSKHSPSATLVVTDTDRLSVLADAILALSGNPRLSKNTVLNRMAKTLTGQNLNWGALKACDKIQFAGPRPEDLRALLLAEHAPGNDAPIEPLPSTFWLEGDKVIFLFNLAEPGRAQLLLPAPFPLAELPALLQMMATPGTRYSSENLSFSCAGTMLRVTKQINDDHDGTLDIPVGALSHFAAQHQEIIEKTIIAETSAGRHIHTAFEMVGQTQGVELLWNAAEEVSEMEMTVHHEGQAANVARIERACRAATLMLLRTAASDSDLRRHIRTHDREALVNLVFDETWELLFDALVAELERSSPDTSLDG